MNFLLVVLLAVVPMSVLGRGHAGKVVTVDSFVWNLEEPREIKIDAKSQITIDFEAQIAPQSHSIRGKNLWRLGIFGSEHSDGQGERVGFKSQILKTKQASKRPTTGQPLRMRNIISRFDLSQIGCNQVRYFCVEFAKNSDSTVDFELRSGTVNDSIVSCKEMECRRPNANATVAGGETLPELIVPKPTAFLSGMGVSVTRFGLCRDGSHNISVDVVFLPYRLGDTIRGNGLWRLGIFLSNASNGAMARSQYKPDILKAGRKAKSLIPGEIFRFKNVYTTLHTTGVGCPESDLQYICLEFDKGENPIPDFRFPNGPVIQCLQLSCVRPKPRRKPVNYDDVLAAFFKALFGKS